MGVDTLCSTLQLPSTQTLVVAPPCCKLVTNMYGQAAVHQTDRCCGCTLAACRECHRMQCCSQFVSLVWSVPMARWWWSSLSCCQWPSDSGHLQPCVYAKGWESSRQHGIPGVNENDHDELLAALLTWNVWGPTFLLHQHIAMHCMQVRAGQTKEGPGRELWHCLGF